MDTGIARDPAVLFHDDFEDGEVGASWDEVNLRQSRGATDDSQPLAGETDRTIARGQRSARAQLRKDGHEDVTLVKGNWFQPQPDQVPKRETWVGIEWLVKANTPGQADGELDCWIDGQQRGESFCCL